MLKIILDTNFLMIPAKFKVDVFDELEKVINQKFRVVVPRTVVEELEKLSKSRGRDAAAARVGLELVEKEGVEVVDTEKAGDEGILELAERKCAVATVDKGLKTHLKKKKIPIIYLREGKHLILE